ncbi:hypothetical protein M4578_03135 [Salipiger sp. P9]|uniref:hypothetical protein n=1 Tax=Salipiger pentaromativorans TaxID=2943193 RepID=UPI002157A45B|nr:hypothetical protein [Salipiger pentaromativorans]MCR8546809.1 hypothetical protein [Salipiger pentaromativorans]
MSMIEDQHIGPAVARLERLFEEKLSLRRGGFERRAAQARRILPRGLRNDLAQVLEARRAAGHPKLARMVNGAAVSAAAGRIEAHLKAIDLADRRRGRLLSLLGGVMLNLLLVFAAVMALLLWRGFV